MKISARLASLGATALLSTSLLCAGDEGFGADLKLRVSSAPGSTKDHLNSAAYGLGLNFRNTFSWGTLNGELAYFYNPGRQYLNTTFPAAAAGTGDPVPDYTNDSRKNRLDMVSLRLSYENVIQGDWSWQAGLSLGQAKFRHEYVADISDAATYEDTYNGTPTKSKFSVSPFVGFNYRVNKDSAVEVNLTSVQYTAIDFQHTPGAPVVGGSTSTPGSHLVYDGDKLVETNRRSFRIELGYTFRF